MAPLASFLAVASLVSLVTAVPSPKIGITAGTTVHQVRNPSYVANGPLALYKTYLKYGVTPSENLRKAVERSGFLNKRSEATVKATPTDNVDDAYTIPVSIGTPPQVLQLNLDTGSSDLWVFSTETESDDVDGQKLYNPSSSSTSKNMAGYTWSVSYGDGSSANGDIYTDKVSVGGITVSKQAVELAQSVSTSFTSETASDGILGMGFDNINKASPSAVQTFFGNAQSKLNSPLFTADLKYHAVGSYGFGFINSSLYTGSIAYEDVDTSEGWWSWTSSGYAIGSGSFVSTNVTGVADTGTTLLLLPEDIVEAYYNKVSGSSYSNTYDGFVFPCSSTVPPFTFGVGKLRIKIPASYLNYGPAEAGSSTCFGGIQLNLAVGTSIFGDVALKSAFVVFNGASKPTIGWANKKL